MGDAHLPDPLLDWIAHSVGYYFGFLIGFPLLLALFAGAISIYFAVRERSLLSPEEQRYYLDAFDPEAVMRAKRNVYLKAAHRKRV